MCVLNRNIPPGTAQQLRSVPCGTACVLQAAFHSGLTCVCLSACVLHPSCNEGWESHFEEVSLIHSVSGVLVEGVYRWYLFGKCNQYRLLFGACPPNASYCR